MRDSSSSSQQQQQQDHHHTTMDTSSSSSNTTSHKKGRQGRGRRWCLYPLALVVLLGTQAVGFVRVGRWMGLLMEPFLQVEPSPSQSQDMSNSHAMIETTSSSSSSSSRGLQHQHRFEGNRNESWREIMTDNHDTSSSSSSSNHNYTMDHPQPSVQQQISYNTSLIGKEENASNHVATTDTTFSEITTSPNIVTKEEMSSPKKNKNKKKKKNKNKRGPAIPIPGNGISVKEYMQLRQQMEQLEHPQPQQPHQDQPHDNEANESDNIETKKKKKKKNRKNKKNKKKDEKNQDNNNDTENNNKKTKRKKRKKRPKRRQIPVEDILANFTANYPICNIHQLTDQDNVTDAILRSDPQWMDAANAIRKRGLHPTLLNTTTSTLLNITTATTTAQPEQQKVESANSNNHHALIIPYRDRTAHLETFLSYMSVYLSIQFPNSTFTLWIMEQGDSTLFNRAWLGNVGLRHILEREPHTQCVTLHDIDLIPFSTHTQVSYNDCDTPLQLASELESFKWSHPYDENCGGITSLSLQHWQQINGLSNDYAGWGGEDDDLYHRMRMNGLLLPNPRNISSNPVPRRPPLGQGKFKALSRRWEHHTSQRYHDNTNHTAMLLAEMGPDHNSTRWKEDGINDVYYRIVDETSLALPPSSSSSRANKIVHIRAVAKEPRVPVASIIAKAQEIPTATDFIARFENETDPSTLRQVEETLSRMQQHRDSHKSSESLTKHRHHAIVLPYRDRDFHLQTFLSYMKVYLGVQFQNSTFTVWVIEQGDEQLFNRAWLGNVGLSQIISKEPHTECVTFHDVDFIPNSTSIHIPYDDCETPLQLANELSTFNWSHPYPTNMGGITLLSLSHWKKINGFSNDYEGWGGEDDDLYERLRINGLLIPPGTNVTGGPFDVPVPRRPPLGQGVFRSTSQKEADHASDKGHDKRTKTLLLLKQMFLNSTRWKHDGLSDLYYTIQQEQSFPQAITSGGLSNIIHISAVAKPAITTV